MVLRDWRSGKISTVFAADDVVPLLAEAKNAGRTQTVIQITRFPSLATFRRRREVLTGQFGTQAPGSKLRASACFFSASGAGTVEAAALVSRLRHEGREVSQSLSSYAAKHEEGKYP
jgi:hypothetical protein